jgi:1,4-dihydroxy-2-naphthoyl-CoA synthase
MGDRLGNFPGCAQVRTKIHRKDYGWSVRLLYDPRELSEVMAARLGVAEVLQMVSDLTLAVSRAHTGQLRRIWWRTGQGRGYVPMMCGSSRRDTVWYIYY